MATISKLDLRRVLQALAGPTSPGADVLREVASYLQAEAARLAANADRLGAREVAIGQRELAVEVREEALRAWKRTQAAAIESDTFTEETSDARS